MDPLVILKRSRPGDRLEVINSNGDKDDIVVAQEGRTLVPLRLYFKHGLAKAEIAVGRGKRAYDKRAAQAEPCTPQAQRDASAAARCSHHRGLAGGHADD